MNRRDFLKMMGATGVAGALGSASAPAFAATSTLYTGKVLMTIHAGGGWDHSSFADPRENPTINHWAADQADSPAQKAGTAGNLRFAPFAENEAFFNKYYQHMLVINGIDLQTNGHDAARRYRSTGSLTAGLPSLNELFAATVAPKAPMPFVRAGGYGQTVGVMPFTTLPDEALLRSLADPNSHVDGRKYYAESHMSILDRYRQERLASQLADPTNLPRWRQKLLELQRARAGTQEFAGLGSLLPETLDSQDLTGAAHRGVRDMHLFLLLASAGMTATGGFSIGGWDTHGNHDVGHTGRVRHLTRMVDYLWTKAAAMGIDDRLVVHITSDVGRTPRYNANNGKDHWSVGADVIMAKQAPWANRIVGMSGPAHERVRIDPNTLQADEQGIHLRPKHVHAALRDMLGIRDHALAKRYALDAETMPLFDASISTGIQV